MRIAEAVEDVLENLSDFENVLYELLDALGKGVSIAEVMYAFEGREIRPVELRFRPQQAFRFGTMTGPQTGPLRLGVIGAEDEIMPLNKFVVHSFRPHLGNRWGRPLGRRCFWPTWFKRQTIRFWLKFTEKGTGTVVAKYPAGSSADEKNLALQTAEAVNDETAVAIAETFVVELLEHARQGGVGIYKALAEGYANSEVSKIVLGQVLTSAGSDEGSGSRALGEVHNEVRAEKIGVDAQSLMRVVNEQVIGPFVTLNFGPNVERPKWVIDYEQDEDLAALAERDERLVRTGVAIPASYFHDRYQLPVPEAGEEVVRPLAKAGKPDAEFAEQAPIGPGDRELMQALREIVQGFSPAADDGRLRRMQAVSVLSQRQCAHCGRKKARKRAFCMACYYTLPASERHGLYQRVGEGFEEALDTALARLRGPRTVPEDGGSEVKA